MISSNPCKHVFAFTSLQVPLHVCIRSHVIFDKPCKAVFLFVQRQQRVRTTLSCQRFSLNMLQLVLFYLYLVPGLFCFCNKTHTFSLNNILVCNFVNRILFSRLDRFQLVLFLSGKLDHLTRLLLGRGGQLKFQPESSLVCLVGETR